MIQWWQDRCRGPGGTGQEVIHEAARDTPRTIARKARQQLSPSSMKMRRQKRLFTRRELRKDDGEAADDKLLSPNGNVPRAFGPRRRLPTAFLNKPDLSMIEEEEEDGSVKSGFEDVFGDEGGARSGGAQQVDGRDVHDWSDAGSGGFEEIALAR